MTRDANHQARPQTPRHLLERLMQSEARCSGVQGLRVSGSPHRRVKAGERRFVGSYNKARLTRTANADLRHRQPGTKALSAGSQSSQAAADMSPVRPPSMGGRPSGGFVEPPVRPHNPFA